MEKVMRAKVVFGDAGGNRVCFRDLFLSHSNIWARVLYFSESLIGGVHVYLLDVEDEAA